MKKPCYVILLFLLSIFCAGCSQETDQPLQGYIEGEYTYISSGISGTLFDLAVSRGQPIQKNQLLFTLDPEPDQAAAESAAATVQQMQEETNLSKIQWERQERLYAKNATDKSTLDQAETDYKSKIEQLRAAKNDYTQATWALQQKTVPSPIDGFVFDTFFRLGEKVPANQPVLALLSPKNIRVLFYIPETLLSTIHLGQTITIDCDSCKTKTHAAIQYISSDAEYTPPIIYSKDTRYKLVYLVRADLPKNKVMEFHPGQPLDIILHE